MDIVMKEFLPGLEETSCGRRKFRALKYLVTDLHTDGLGC